MKSFGNNLNVQASWQQPLWRRILILCIIGYEALGCLSGGILLILEPDGKLMDMPVEMMHGVFRDFFIPGIILFALGILNSFAFVAVLKRKTSDWLLAGLALGGLLIWFIVEIAILKEIHWLHGMWGLPVLLGWIFVIPLIASQNEPVVAQISLLTCGIFSSVWYIIINIIAPMFYEGYSMLSQAPSELSAINAPTRILWILLAIPYPLLFAALGWGVLAISANNRNLKIVGNLIILYCVLNLYWPPMHMREVIAAGGGTLTDTLHIVWACMTVIFMMLFMGLGAAALGKKFRKYTVVNFIAFIVFGILTFRDSTFLEANLPTPLMGLWERINIAAFMLWVIIFSMVLLRKKVNLWQNS